MNYPHIEPTAPLLHAQILSVEWATDAMASEEGYALRYRCFGNAQGATLLADERGLGDPEVYIGDWVRLRPVGMRRHTLVDVMTGAGERAADAARVDWVAIHANRALVAPAQSVELTPADVGGTEDRDRFYQQRHPQITAWLARRAARTVVAAGTPSEFTNGGW